METAAAGRAHAGGFEVAAAEQQVGRRDGGKAEDGVSQEVPARRLNHSAH
jgi:hypothetical protein